MRSWTIAGLATIVVPSSAVAGSLEATQRAAIISCVEQKKTVFETNRPLSKPIKVSVDKTSGTEERTETDLFHLDVEDGYLFLPGTGKWADQKIDGHSGSFADVSISDDRKRADSSITCTGFNVGDAAKGETDCKGTLTATEQRQTDPASLRRFILDCTRSSY